MNEFQPDWKLSSIDTLAIKLSIALSKHIPDWPGATDEQLAAVAGDIMEQPGAIDHRAISEKLKDLYAKTGEDWDLRIVVSLTEPTCPVASITCDSRRDSTRYVQWGNSVDEAVNLAVEMIYNEIILGKRGKHGAPWTNPSDHLPEPTWMPPEEET